MFNDTQISHNNTKSCASCHNQNLAFTDGYRTSITANGEHLLKNSPTLLYLKNNKFFDYSNPNITSLEQQHLRPLFGRNPIELGTDSIAFLNHVNNDTSYTNLFRNYGVDSISSMQNIIVSIADYIKLLSPYNSPYDHYMNGDSLALTHNQIAGMKLFKSDRINCVSCHGGPNFTLTNITSIPNLVYPRDHWNSSISDHPIKIPTLRNIAVTDPYMHDGSINTIKEIIDKYNEHLKPLNGFRVTSMNEEEKLQLIDFMYALTDEEYNDN